MIDGGPSQTCFLVLRNDKLQQMKDGLIEAGAETKYTYDDKHADPVKIQFLGIDGQAAPDKDAKGAELDSDL